MKKLQATLVACLVPIYLMAGSGDVNGDGLVSKTDIDAIIGYIMKTSPTVTRESADINEDGDVNAADIVELINIINQPVIITEDIGSWTEMRTFADGSLITVKNLEGRETPEEVLMILPSEELGILYSYIKFDDNEVPKYITLNDNIIIVDSYDGNNVDLTVVYENTTAYTVTGIPFSSSGVNKTRAANENNLVRNTTAWVELVSGVVGVVSGSFLVAGSIVSEAGTLGASTPISVPGIVAGSATIAGGCSTFKDGWDKLLAPGRHSSNLAATIGLHATSELIPRGLQNAAIPEKYKTYFENPNYSTQISRIGWINFFVGLTAGTVDNLYGRTVTWENLRDFYYQKDENGNGNVMTGLCKEITSSSATLRGYISPSITVSQLDGSSLENEYGIIVVSNSDPSDRQLQKSSGSGGILEYTFNNLKPNTIYNYRTYYIDKTNVISLLGEIKTFQTKQYSLPTISDFKVTKSQYSKGAFSNDGKSFDYCFNASVTISFPLADREYVEDWGYVYKDPDGKTKKISTSTANAEFVDNRYAYYRNQSISTVCLYPYAKFKGMDEIIYGDPTEYDLIYATTVCPDNNHPHWIDLGLPSGTLWRCCNEGASAPEEYGGYYEFGQVGSAPSFDQIEELVDYTTSVWTTVVTTWQNWVNGRKFTGSNGGTIFLPAHGYCWDDVFLGLFSSGSYWSSTPYDEFGAYGLHFSSNYAGRLETSRYYGLSVRPVR